MVGAVQQARLQAHWARLSGDFSARLETQEHGIISFDDGRLGIYHWTDVAYD